jgi:predicted TIM-barrel fold metal-dependent hydrolase
MKLILAHFGPPEETLPSLLKYRHNIFIDTCLTTGRHLQIEHVVRTVGAERVLFATDATFNSLVAGFSKVAFADLPEEEKKMIFGRNAGAVFGKALP